MTDQPPNAEFGSDSAVAAYFGVHIKSISRWDRRPELGFPPAVRINNRKYRRWREVHEFARRAAATHASARAS